jgi:hypothetical protein
MPIPNGLLDSGDPSLSLTSWNARSTSKKKSVFKTSTGKYPSGDYGVWCSRCFSGMSCPLCLVCMSAWVAIYLHSVNTTSFCLSYMPMALEATVVESPFGFRKLIGTVYLARTPDTSRPWLETGLVLQLVL